MTNEVKIDKNRFAPVFEEWRATEQAKSSHISDIFEFRLSWSRSPLLVGEILVLKFSISCSKMLQLNDIMMIDR